MVKSQVGLGLGLGSNSLVRFGIGQIPDRVRVRVKSQVELGLGSNFR